MAYALLRTSVAFIASPFTKLVDIVDAIGATNPVHFGRSRRCERRPACQGDQDRSVFYNQVEATKIVPVPKE
jgi:hypothetical protein